MPPLAPLSPLIHQIPALTTPPRMAKPELFYMVPLSRYDQGNSKCLYSFDVTVPICTPLRVKHLEMGFHNVK
jgi:hypothetical protein